MADEGPTILWEQLKNKPLKTNDGKDLGKIKEVVQNYIRLEKGAINKNKYWVPKFVADAYDGKVLWLLVSGDDIVKGYSCSTHPAPEVYTQEFESFRTTPYAQKATYLPDFDQKIRMRGEREPHDRKTMETFGIWTSQAPARLSQDVETFLRVLRLALRTET